MGSVCIVTDSSAQFPQVGFPGRNNIRVVPFDIEISGVLYPEGQNLKASNLPPTAGAEVKPRVVAPTAEKMFDFFTNLGKTYDEIIGIFISSSINPLIENAQKAANAIAGRPSITLIDSQTISVGLGILVQMAAEAYAGGTPSGEIERMVRSQVPHIYSLLCTPGLSYLAQAGLVDDGQATVSEMLGLYPIFALEEGQLSAIEKARNTRVLLDFFQEFVSEFDTLHAISFIQSQPPLTHEARTIRNFIQETFPKTPFSEHTLNVPLATLTGPRTTGLVVVEKPIP